MIYVALNYRLGAFGWLAGPEVAKDGILNAGLHDQRLALDWVQRDIHLLEGLRKESQSWANLLVQAVLSYK